MGKGTAVVEKRLSSGLVHLMCGVRVEAIEAVGVTRAARFCLGFQLGFSIRVFEG